MVIKKITTYINIILHHPFQNHNHFTMKHLHNTGRKDCSYLNRKCPKSNNNGCFFKRWYGSKFYSSSSILMIVYYFQYLTQISVSIKEMKAHPNTCSPLQTNDI